MHRIAPQVPPQLLIALILVAEQRAKDVDIDVLRELQSAGFVAELSRGWVLSAAGAARVRRIDPQRRAELACLASAQATTK